MPPRYTDPNVNHWDPANRPPERPLGGNNGSAYHGPGWVPNGCDSLVPALPQKDTNGNSPWGVLPCPNLPPYLPNNPCPTCTASSSSGVTATRSSGSGSASSTGASGNASGSSTGRPGPTGLPWGDKNATDNNPYTDAPYTGVTRHYDFTISYKKIAPDGVMKDGLVINDGFPGPLIEANWGDWIEVKVKNLLPDEGAALHWHGITQKGTPWMDGVPAVQQCPIVPNATFTYRFRADLYGSSWYHSHYSAQYAGGAFGPMIIHGPKHGEYDVDVGPIMLSDWYHDDYYKIVNQTVRQGRPPPSNNNLINGKMNYPCANTTKACTPNAGVSKFTFKSGKKHLLRLINTSADGMQKFSIDNHTMTVISDDFVPINPYKTDLITLGVGQRADVVVEAKGNPSGAYWMRASLGRGLGACSLVDGVSPNAVAAIYYESANTSAVPASVSDITEARIKTCQNDDLALVTPLFPITPDPNPTQTQQLDITFGSNGTHQVWKINNSSFRGNFNDPVLLRANQGNLTFPTEANVYNFGNSKSVRFVVYNKFQFLSHPMHMHGHNMYVLAQGFGTWDGVVTNPSNPQRRDVHILPPARDAGATPSYIVVQFDLDNPGVWPFHCHVAWHVSAGLYINILERPDDIAKYNIPAAFEQTCVDWNKYSGLYPPNQIDSGL
ncbi:hypothetical protein W97_05232 [Coniosporium apollinis CBS 100218]|uniref:Laccase n=1 Tax=Coniosporium apollinis (strain CBS 100218) TaxID=1168221 RepID=R7YW00_CONA1|nr:uncharacterized protein W97_05232 [Coniosporium apollinis CBS 100218]EON65989.1 hypothetical protein W97_05232 [Coniosporium apollinis CBS 100218]